MIDDVMDIDKLKELGKFTKILRDEVRKLVVVEGSYLDVAETIEGMILEKGYKPTFPVNISVNEVAAHDTPDQNDERLFNEEDVVKVDFGVMDNTTFTDNALTIDLSGKHEDMVKAVDEALRNAVNTIKPGITVEEVSTVIENTIRKYGFKPISNLTGHKMEPYILHAGINIPNVKTKNNYSFKVGDVFAIEPFATTQNGAGYVKDSEDVKIFSLINPKMPRMRQSRKLLNHILNNYVSMPFAERWVLPLFDSKIMARSAIKELLKIGSLEAYPVLKEANADIIVQSETTIVVEEDGAKDVICDGC